MAKKSPPKKQAKMSKPTAKNIKPTKPMAKMKPKAKIPSLGGSLTGLGGTGAQGGLY